MPPIYREQIPRNLKTEAELKESQLEQCAAQRIHDAMKGFFSILERDSFTWRAPFRARPLVSRGAFYPVPGEAEHLEMNAWVEKYYGTEVKLCTQLTTSLGEPVRVPVELSQVRDEAYTNRGELVRWAGPGTFDHSHSTRLYRLNSIAETLDLIATTNNIHIPRILGDLAIQSETH